MFKILQYGFKPMFNCFKNICKHKYYVYKYGRLMGLGRIQLLKHDLSKFLPSEFFYYTFRYYTDKKIVPSKYEYGWFLHKKRNKHHPEYWLDAIDKDTVEYWSMPERYIKEMIADWIAASVVYGSNINLGMFNKNIISNWKWFDDNIEGLSKKFGTFDLSCLLSFLKGYFCYPQSEEIEKIIEKKRKNENQSSSVGNL